ncbi:hypothetical protein ACVI1L_005199 [Bradyrhizobium sp. USDA 4516]
MGLTQPCLMKLLPPPLGISGILYRLSVFGNSAWEILYNDPDERFSRRDRSLRQVGIVDRILPPAPDLAIRILPDVTRARAKPDLTSPLSIPAAAPCAKGCIGA